MQTDNLRYKKLALNNGSGAIPALGFGTLIPDPIATRNATKAALEAGFRQLDASERYRNEKEVGEALQEVFKTGKIRREEVFIATKLWNNNHRPERVKPAFEASLRKLQLDYVDLYLIHTPFAFQPRFHWRFLLPFFLQLVDGVHVLEEVLPDLINGLFEGLIAIGQRDHAH